MARKDTSAVVIREAVAGDVPACGQICYDAFATINVAHGFPLDIPNAEVGAGVISSMLADPNYYCVVAEIDGRVVGSNGLDERSIIRGVGPITIDPGAQNMGVGRLLMQAVMDRARDRGAPGVRLVQAAFHNRSFSLYSTFGFDVREPLSCMQGQTRERSVSGCEVRLATSADVDTCNALSRRVHGFDRVVELAQAISHGTARVVERGGASRDTRRIWRSLATQHRRRIWIFRRYSLRSSPLVGLESLCHRVTALCCGGVCRMVFVWFSR